MILPVLIRSRNSSLAISSGYQLNCRIQFPASQVIFIYSATSRLALRSTQPSIQSIPGTLSFVVKREEREAHSSLVQLHCPICLHDAMFNLISTGTTLPLLSTVDCYLL
jgi:hypothetical protein